jgi:hypothetical protein
VSHNALDPNLMTPAERLREVGEILAAGLLRLRARTAAMAMASAETEPSASMPMGRRKRSLCRGTAP